MYAPSTATKRFSFTRDLPETSEQKSWKWKHKIIDNYLEASRHQQVVFFVCLFLFVSENEEKELSSSVHFLLSSAFDFQKLLYVSVDY